MENMEYVLENNLILKVKDTKVIIMDRCIVHKGCKRGLFVLDLTRPCSYPDLEVLPAMYIECKNEAEEAEIKKANIVIGRLEDTCLP